MDKGLRFGSASILSTPKTLFLALLVAITPLSVLAGTTGKIAGRVTIADTGESLPGVQIIVSETNQGTVSDADGYYTIVNVRPGTYTVVFRFVGFAEYRVQNVQVIVDKTTTVDVEMEEAVIEGEEITVVAERPLIQIDRTTTTSYIDEQQIDALPVVSIGQVVNLQAGVVNGHFRGGRTGEVAYLVNGVPINNPFDNTPAFEVETNMVSGLEVISGVFNAEYGQAMSGVVNVVTKDVPRTWTGSLSGEVGGTASMRELEFVERVSESGAGLRLGDFESVKVSYSEAAGLPGRIDAQATLGGPLIAEKLGLRLTGRAFYDEGSVIGRRLFMPSDSSLNLNSSNPNAWFIESTGDQEFVSPYQRRYSVNGALVFRPVPKVKIEYNAIVQTGYGRGSNHQRKYVPDGINRYYLDSQFHLAGLHLTLSNHSFANLNFSYLRDEGSSRLFDVPPDFDETGILDLRYQSPRLETLEGTNAFDVGGNDLFNGKNLTETITFLADYTNQVNRVHQVKVGVSARLHHLFNGNYGIEVGPRTSWLPMPAVDIYGRDTLETRPRELAAYLQDKMEFKSLIVNAGLRFDYFDPDYRIPVDWTQAGLLRIPRYDDEGNPTGDSLLNRQKSPIRTQLSPRIGIAFPISSTGVIRFSAGLFFQIPQFSILYTNPHYEVNPAANTTNFGNPSLDPERTLHFEVGLQQGLTDAFGIELTLFAKDIRNLTGVEIQRDVLTTNFFVRYINRDVGSSRGVTLALFQRPVGKVSWNIDYTLQFAKGTSSNPTEAFDRFQSGQEEILSLVRLDWDNRHVLNNQITLTPAPELSVTMINRFQTGAPYTTIRNYVTSLVENNDDRPSLFLTDIQLYYSPSFFPGLRASVQVDNLFDAQVHYGVYSDTGRGDESRTMEDYRRAGTQVGGLNSLDEYFFNQSWFSGPRRVTVGLRYQF